MPVTAAPLRDQPEPDAHAATRQRRRLEVVAPATAAESTATSVDKALAVLEAFRGPGTVLGVTEVARRGNLSKSSAHRMLGLLVERGYVQREGIGYALGSMLFELGNSMAYSRARSLRAIAMPYMVELLAATSAAVHLSVLVESDLMVLERVFGHRGVGCVPDIGSRTPAAGTAAGDVIRAFSGVPPQSPQDALRLREARRRRMASQECGVGRSAICMSAPVLSASSGVAVAAVSLVLPRDQLRLAGLDAALRSTGRRIGDVL